VSKNILPHMILSKNNLPRWMNLSHNILMMCGKYTLGYPFLHMLTLTCSQNNIPIIISSLCQISQWIKILTLTKKTFTLKKKKHIFSKYIILDFLNWKICIGFLFVILHKYFVYEFFWLSYRDPISYIK
jgi:hypothetical protein